MLQSGWRSPNQYHENPRQGTLAAESQAKQRDAFKSADLARMVSCKALSMVVIYPPSQQM